MTYAEAVARLLALRGGELAGMRPGLERIQALLAAIGHPERAYRIVQVAGTNGKGSVAAMLAAIFAAAGRRAGLLTSPHLRSFRERIRVNGAAIPEDDVVDGMEALGTLIARLDVTMFEAATALALDHFASSGVEIAVLEVGLGGRLDSTTVGTPVAEVITRIDLDHQAYLGDTIAAIAAEKAAIIRSGIALSARQDPAAAAVIAARAREVGVPLLVEGRDLHVTVRARSLAGQRLDLAGPGWRLDDVTCGLLAVYQESNALLAAAAARTLGEDDDAIRRGLARAQWPGRFQVVSGSTAGSATGPTVVMDAAHNPAGAHALAASLHAYFPGRPITLVVGIFADKDAPGIVQALAPLAARVICTASIHPRSSAPADLSALVPPGGARVETAGSVAEAMDRAIGGAAGPEDVICVAGSVSVVGEALARYGQPPDLLCGLAPDC
jgi:dihydrofolate synthase/folylpolyglutamate synthase